MKHSKRLSGRILTAGLLALVAIAIGAVFGAAGSGQAASQAVPQEQSPPTISGTPQEGQTLTADPGKWTSSTKIKYTFQWRRCDKAGGNCAGISGATARLYDVKSQDVGHTLRVHVTATNADGSASDTSAPTAVVIPKTAPPPPPAPTGRPAGNGPITIAQVSPPARLLIDGMSSNPSTIGRNPGTLTWKFHVTACGGRAVSGASVYATAVPFSQFSDATQPTGADGWATLTVTQQAHYPASRLQQLLAVFVRATKPGENPLGGVSTRRLVSFPVNLHQ